MKTKDMILVAIFAVLTMVGARISIPTPIVPVTLQFLFVALSGILLGARLGAASQALYIGMGLLGLPVFAKGGGLGYVLTPTFGYLIGFILCAYIIGKLCENGELTIVKTFIATFVGLMVVYALGIAYMLFIKNVYIGSGNGMTFYKAISIGFLPTILLDIGWCIVISIISPRLKKVLVNGKILSR